jgi:hypothetical protein
MMEVSMPARISGSFCLFALALGLTNPDISIAASPQQLLVDYEHSASWFYCPPAAVTCFYVAFRPDGAWLNFVIPGGEGRWVNEVLPGYGFCRQSDNYPDPRNCRLFVVNSDARGIVPDDQNNAVNTPNSAQINPPPGSRTLSSSDRRCHLDDRYRSALRGQHLTPSLEREILSNTGAASMRALGPGQFGTADYIEDRVHVYTDKNGVITDVNCG